MQEKAVDEYFKHKRRENLNPKRFIQNYILPLAAAILVLLLVSNIITFSISPEMAFRKYYKDYTPTYYAQATIDKAQLLFANSLNEYNKGNFTVVTENMRNLMENGELNVRGQIVLAFYDAWKTNLFGKLDTTDTEQEDALWYLAVTSLKLNDLRVAQSFFREIETDYPERAKKAARMDRKISKMLLAK